jgi:4-hydroxythreonine-4-phosphate dehydrogenase
MGDPAGVGPELCLRLLANKQVAESCIPVVFGDAALLERVALHGSLPLPQRVERVENPSSLSASANKLNEPVVVDLNLLAADQIQPGTVSASTGQASFDYIQKAIDAALADQVDAVVTCPINKEAWNAADISYPGHTELFADRADSERFCMMMAAPAFSCSLVTTHIGYHEVPAELSTSRILEVIQLSHEAMHRIHNRDSKLIVLGLNPHAGEGGLFGNQEEETIIQPAIDAAKKMGIDIEGPLPPDTAFLPWRRESTDCFICMYHDQGLIPFKALNFDTGVNITLGLPIIRTSVDHGTALDIAWQGKADVSSLIAAVNLATALARK